MSKKLNPKHILCLEKADKHGYVRDRTIAKARGYEDAKEKFSKIFNRDNYKHKLVWWYVDEEQVQVIAHNK